MKNQDEWALVSHTSYSLTDGQMETCPWNHSLDIVYQTTSPTIQLVGCGRGARETCSLNHFVYLADVADV